MRRGGNSLHSIIWYLEKLLNGGTLGRFPAFFRGYRTPSATLRSAEDILCGILHISTEFSTCGAFPVHSGAESSVLGGLFRPLLDAKHVEKGTGQEKSVEKCRLHLCGGPFSGRSEFRLGGNEKISGGG